MTGDWASPGAPSGVATQPGAVPPDPDPGTVPAAATAAAGFAAARCDAKWPGARTDRIGSANPLEPLEPVGVGGVLDGAFDLLRHRFGALVGLAAAMFLPLQLLEVLAELRSGLDAVPSTTGVEGFFDLVAAGGGSTTLDWVLVAGRVLALSFLGVVTGAMVADLLRGEQRTTSLLVAAGVRRWWVALLVPVLCVPVKAAGACFLYVGFFAADALLMCASVVAGAEGRGPLHAFGRSWRLAGPNYGTAIGVSVGGFLIALVLQAALWLGPVLLAGQFVSSEGLLLVVQQVGLLSMLVVQPLTACIAARAYVELRCRGEGLDIELRRARVGLA